MIDIELGNWIGIGAGILVCFGMIGIGIDVDFVALAFAALARIGRRGDCGGSS